MQKTLLTVTALGAALIGAAVLPTTPAEAQGFGFRSMPRGVPGLMYRGVRGWHRTGWELGRMSSMRQYRIDPGPYPGFYNRQSWSAPWRWR
jgi:hypothetical protein